MQRGCLVVAEPLNLSKSTNTPHPCSLMIKKALVMPSYDDLKINYLQACEGESPVQICKLSH
jgi:hypothetical protein